MLGGIYGGRGEVNEMTQSLKELSLRRRGISRMCPLAPFVCVCGCAKNSVVVRLPNQVHVESVEGGELQQYGNESALRTEYRRNRHGTRQHPTLNHNAYKLCIM